MRSGTGISSVNDDKVAYTQEEAKESIDPGGGQAQGRVGHRNRNTSTCGTEAEERDLDYPSAPPAPAPHYLLYVSPL